MSYYRLTVFDEAGTKIVISEDEDPEGARSEIDTALEDLFNGGLKSVVISRITGRTGIRDDI